MEEITRKEFYELCQYSKSVLVKKDKDIQTISVRGTEPNTINSTTGEVEKLGLNFVALQVHFN